MTILTGALKTYTVNYPSAIVRNQRPAKNRRVWRETRSTMLYGNTRGELSLGAIHIALKCYSQERLPFASMGEWVEWQRKLVDRG